MTDETLDDPITLTAVTDAPAVYPCERTFTVDYTDATGTATTLRCVITVREAAIADPRQLALACDAWEVDNSGLPTGVCAARQPVTRLRSTLVAGAVPGAGTLPELVTMKRADMARALVDLKRGAQHLADPELGIQLLPAVAPDPAADLAHPLADAAAS